MQTKIPIILIYLLLHIAISQFYNHRTSTLSNPAWMALLDNGIPLRQLSIIGSHSSMSQGTWGDAFQTQSNSLTNQMKMGMRAFDIRCRHTNNQLKIYDRIVYLNTDLGGVLSTIRTYLLTNTMQVILMHIVQEGSGSGNTGTFQNAFLTYYNNFLDIIWTPTTQNPVLGETRGKVVIIQDFTASAIYGLLYSTFTVLPHRTYSTNWDQYNKWVAVKAFIKSANTAGLSQLSFWTGNVGSFPYFVASGKSSPGNGDPLLATGLTTPGFKSSYPDFPRVACFIGICTIAFQGINNLAFNYIISQSVTYTGIVFTDFVGDDIITKSISFNTGKFVPCPTTQITQGCSYCSNTGQCLGCNTTLHYVYNTANFSCLAATGYYLFWNNATANTPTMCNISMPGCLACSSFTVCLSCDILAHYQLSSGTCIAAPGYYLNASSIPVICTLVGCYQCASATVCSNCSAALNYILNTGTSLCQCNAANQFVQNPSIPACLCIGGYYLAANNTCQTIPVCPALNSGCSSCDTLVPACTLCDAANHFITDSSNTALCTCDIGYYFDGNTCIACSVSLTQACLTCANQNLCLSCPANFTLTNGICLCQAQFYSYNTSKCLMCQIGCLMCTSATMCQACDKTNNFTMLNNLCQCLPGMYLSGTVCVPCGSMAGCLTCTMSGCTSCDPIFGFSLNTTSQLCECAIGQYINQMDVCAQCTQLGCLDCDSLTICTNCSVYFYLSSGVCLQVCGDGLLYNLPCDDGNLINGDGCSSTCQIQTDYTCVGGSTISASACSFSGTLNINVASMTKDPSANKVYLSATIQPTLAQLSALDFTSVFLPDFPVQTTEATYDPNTGAIAMTFTYNTSLNAAALAVSFVPPATPAYFYMPVTKVSLPQVTNNNLALKAYSQQQYESISKIQLAVWAVSLGAVGTFLVGFFFISKLMAIEMILIFQVTYAALLILQKLELFMVPLRNLKIVNGYNQLLAGSNSGIPGRIAQISYKSAFLSNFSMDILIIMLPILVGGLALIIGKITKKKTVRLFSYKVLKQWLFSALLFVQIHLGVSLCLNIIYDNNTKMIGLALGGTIELCIIAELIVFVKSPKNFGEYKQFFKDGWSKQNWYIVVTIMRTLICTLIGYFSNIEYIGYATIGLATLLLIGQLILRPYQSNIRPFVNNLILIGVLSIYQYCKMIKNSIEVAIMSSYIALFLIGLLAFGLVFNLICMILKKYQSWKELKEKRIADQTLLCNQGQTKNIDKQYVQKLKEALKGAAINTIDLSLQLHQDNEGYSSARKIRNAMKNLKPNSSFVQIQLSEAVKLNISKMDQLEIFQDGK